MDFHSFGNIENPTMLLIHGVLTPWQIWNQQIEHFSKSYYVIAVALDAHTEEPSEFISIEDEAYTIENFCINNEITTIDVLCGLSLGAAIAHLIWKNGKVNVNTLILDGAPLVPCGELIGNILTSFYVDIIKKSKARDEDTLKSCTEEFLPGKYLDDYLKIADNISIDSVKNLISSVSTSNLCTTVDNHSNILFIHGSKGNEVLAKKSAKKMQKNYPETTIKYFKDDPHCYRALRKPQEWIEVVQEYLDNTVKH